MSSDSQRLALASQLQRTLGSSTDASWWLLKPPASSQGRGVRVVSLPDLVKWLATSSLSSLDGGSNDTAATAAASDAGAGAGAGVGAGAATATSQCATIAGKMVVQQYIDRPMLLRGHKFDLRVFLLVVEVPQLTTTPTLHGGTVRKFATFYRDGYARQSAVPFDMHSTDPFVHLTNLSVQKHHASFETQKEALTWYGLPLARLRCTLD